MTTLVREGGGERERKRDRQADRQTDRQKHKAREREKERWGGGKREGMGRTKE